MIIIRAMDPYELLWMVLLIVFVLGELATIGLTCIWFAAGALAALVMAMAGVNPVVQFLVFLVVSILLLAATRPWARKYVNAKMQRTNADSLIGENIRISERVSNMDQTGMAVVHGQEWTVRTRNDNEIIEPGEEAKRPNNMADIYTASVLRKDIRACFRPTRRAAPVAEARCF